MNNLPQATTKMYQKATLLRLRYKLLIITLVAICIFALSKGPPPGQNHFVYLAESFLHGQLGVTGDGIALAEIVPFQGNYYVVYPPMPAVLLTPFVAVFGTAFDQGLLSITLASL
ncbi:MAG TPA: hypothetical protein VLL96_05200, partial [Candidatus Deferrimicrobiaceae bacterium]|nr:hypothetical protein [Candidatus Deferrimicrobiaceae bacterium]